MNNHNMQFQTKDVSVHLDIIVQSTLKAYRKIICVIVVGLHTLGQRPW